MRRRFEMCCCYALCSSCTARAGMGSGLVARGKPNAPGPTVAHPTRRTTGSNVYGTGTAQVECKWHVNPVLCHCQTRNR